MAGPISQRFDYYYAPFDIWVDIHVFHYGDGVAFYYRDVTDRSAPKPPAKPPP